MKEYFTPEITILETNTDVIATSGGIHLPLDPANAEEI
jgi:hypothetical protein